jgi:hypothetical protein
MKKFLFPMLMFVLFAISFSVYQSVYVPNKAVQDMCKDARAAYNETKQYAVNRCLGAGSARLKNGRVK